MFSKLKKCNTFLGSFFALVTKRQSNLFRNFIIQDVHWRDLCLLKWLIDFINRSSFLSILDNQEIEKYQRKTECGCGGCNTSWVIRVFHMRPFFPSSALMFNDSLKRQHWGLIRLFYGWTKPFKKISILHYNMFQNSESNLWPLHW